MDKTSYEEINKGKKNFLILVISIFALIGLIIGLFTNCKEETLICNKNENICYVEKTNIFNTKSKNEIIEISDIKYTTYIPKTISGNMYASGYTSYYIAFFSKSLNKPVNIFSTEYYEKDEVKKVISDINEKLKNPDVRTIKLIQKL